MNGSYGHMVDYGIAPTWGAWGARVTDKRIRNLRLRAAKVKNATKRARLLRQIAALAQAIEAGAVPPSAIDNAAMGLDAELDVAGAPLATVPPNPIDVPVEGAPQAPGMTLPVAVGATAIGVTGLAVYFLFFR